MLKLKLSYMVHFAYHIQVNAYFLVWLVEGHGNRGRCAQPCRLPYKLVSKVTDTPLGTFPNGNFLKYPKVTDYPKGNVPNGNGYLLSTRDLCGLEFIPDLISSGVMCFKIEGRMKSPEYVATVTRIYRKYIDLALSDMPYVVDEKDKKELMQVFNRGEFSRWSSF